MKILSISHHRSTSNAFIILILNEIQVKCEKISMGKIDKFYELYNNKSLQLYAKVSLTAKGMPFI